MQQLGPVGLSVSFCEVPEVEYVACYSRGRERGELFAREWGVQKVYTDLEQMAQDDTIDAVYIASPNSLHYEQSKLFLQNGKHVICEKPITVEPEQLEETLGNLGITKDKEIILIGETLDGWGDDARLLWELRAAGYEDVKMVDGGWKALKDSGIKTQFLASKPEPAEVKIDEIDYSHVMTTEELQKNYDEYKIVDVRTDEEYEGAILYDEAKGGHLPGAIHIRYTDLFDDAGYLKSNEELTKMFEDAGLSKDDEIVTYCTGGIRSAYTQLVMEMCGFEHTYNYDQSFWRWAVVGDVE